MIPIFVVVGRVNEGKSSIVASLTENDEVLIGPEPGTTVDCGSYDMMVDGEPLFKVIDTPGFQEPESVLLWMKEREKSAKDRPLLVKEFISTFKKSHEFVDEVRLLSAIMEDDENHDAPRYILYVVDGSHPYRKSYEDEFEIIRRTGKPCIALINSIGPKDFSKDWQTALFQFFHNVRLFNAGTVKFQDRLVLFEALKSFDPLMGDHLQEVKSLLQESQSYRFQDAYDLIAELIFEVLTEVISLPAGKKRVSDSDRKNAILKYNQFLEELEARCRKKVELLFNYKKVERVEKRLDKPIYEKDLFSSETWELLGLSRKQVILTGLSSGLAAGGALDLMVGETSFFTGAILGGVTGLASSAYLSYKAPEQIIHSYKICGKCLVVGPIKADVFPWVLLDRALLHLQAIMDRSHAIRNPMEITEDRDKLGFVSKLEAEDRKKLQKIFNSIAKKKSYEHRHQLADLIKVISEQFEVGYKPH